MCSFSPISSARGKVLLKLLDFTRANQGERAALAASDSCFLKRAKHTSLPLEPLSLRRCRRQPETTPAPLAQPPSRLSQCAPVVCSYQAQRGQLCKALSNICCLETC